MALDSPYPRTLTSRFIPRCPSRFSENVQKMSQNLYSLYWREGAFSKSAINTDSWKPATQDARYAVFSRSFRISGAVGPLLGSAAIEAPCTLTLQAQAL